MKLPDFPIAPILVHFGFEDVPDVPVDGRKRKLRCDFHGDRNPSATVSRYGFHCYACGISGDAIKLLMEQEGHTYASARHLAEELTGGAGDGSAQPATQSGWW